MFSLSLNTYNRKNNKDISALLAYRSGMKLFSLREQTVKYANRKPDDEIIEGFFVDENGAETPQNEHSLQEFADTIDRQELRKNSVIAKGIMLALPKELLPWKRKNLVLQFCKFISIAYKITINANIHNEKIDKNGTGNGNHHAHIILSTRNDDGDKVKELDARTGGRELTRVLRNEWAEILNSAYSDDGAIKRVTPLSFTGRKSKKSIDTETIRINKAYETLGFGKEIESDYLSLKKDNQEPQIKHFNNPERIKLNRELILHNERIRMLKEEFDKLKEEWKQEKGRIIQEEMQAIEAQTQAMQEKADTHLKPINENGENLSQCEAVPIRKSQPKNKLSLRRRITKYKRNMKKTIHKSDELKSKKECFSTKIHRGIVKSANAVDDITKKGIEAVKQSCIKDLELLGIIKSKEEKEPEEEKPRNHRKKRRIKPEGMSDAQWYFGVSDEVLAAAHKKQEDDEEEAKQRELKNKRKKPSKKSTPYRKRIRKNKGDEPQI